MTKNNRHNKVIYEHCNNYLKYLASNDNTGWLRIAL